MIAPDCAGTRERAPDLVVGILDGAERAEALEHVHGCPSCQTYVRDLTGVADALVHLAPEVEPPVGFSARVLTAVQEPRRRRRRLVAGLAAAVAAAAIVSVVVVRVRIDAERSSEQAAAPTIVRSPMMGSDGTRVGEAVTARGGATRLAVAVDYAVDDGRYEVVLRSRGASDVLGTMEIAEGRGEWSGEVGGGDHRSASVDLVDGDGAAVCSADLGDV